MKVDKAILDPVCLININFVSFDELSICFNINEDDQVKRNERGEGKYKSLALKEEEERLQMARELVPEQMMVLQEVVRFCKKLMIPDTSPGGTNSHLRLIVHGGAGVGKSCLVKCVTEYIKNPKIS